MQDSGLAHEGGAQALDAEIIANQLGRSGIYRLLRRRHGAAGFQRDFIGLPNFGADIDLRQAAFNPGAHILPAHPGSAMQHKRDGGGLTKPAKMFQIQAGLNFLVVAGRAGDFVMFMAIASATRAVNTSCRP